MPKAAELLSRYRLAALAVLVSAALHAAVLMGLPPRIAAIEETTAAIYSASIDPLSAVVTTAAPAPAAAPAPRARPRRDPSALPKSRLAPPPPPQPPDVLAAAPVAEPPPPPKPAEPPPEP
jgi:hypothetical protein